MALTNDYRCPVCGEPLSFSQGAYRCPARHCFDLAADGHVNLLPSGRKASRQAGDNRQMVQARRAFLARGYYQFLRNAVSEAVLTAIKREGSSPLVLDCGCGEGYYTSHISQTLSQAGLSFSVLGFDVSKAAVQYAARRDKLSAYAVASVARLPVADGSAGAAVSIFAPVIPKEFARVLQPGGSLFLVTPAEDHLWGLKNLLYEKPYENQVKKFSLEGFSPFRSWTIRQTARVSPREDAENLFKMTPYYWKTPARAAEKLARLDSLETPLSFHIQHLVRLSS